MTSISSTTAPRRTASRPSSAVRSQAAVLTQPLDFLATDKGFRHLFDTSSFARLVRLHGGWWCGTELARRRFLRTRAKLRGYLCEPSRTLNRVSSTDQKESRCGSLAAGQLREGRDSRRAEDLRLLHDRYQAVRQRTHGAARRVREHRLADYLVTAGDLPAPRAAGLESSSIGVTCLAKRQPGYHDRTRGMRPQQQQQACVSSLSSPTLLTLVAAFGVFAFAAALSRAELDQAARRPPLRRRRPHRVRPPRGCRWRAAFTSRRSRKSRRRVSSPPYRTAISSSARPRTAIYIVPGAGRQRASGAGLRDGCRRGRQRRRAARARTVRSTRPASIHVYKIAVLRRARMFRARHD